MPKSSDGSLGFKGADQEVWGRNLQKPSSFFNAIATFPPILHTFSRFHASGTRQVTEKKGAVTGSGSTVDPPECATAKTKNHLSTSVL